MTIPKSECDICKWKDGMYCPIHYVHDPKAEEGARNVAYLAKDFAAVKALGTTSGFFTDTKDGKRVVVSGNVFVEGLWAHVQPQLASYLVVMRRPQYTILTDMALIEAKYTRDAEATFSSTVRAAAILILRLGFQLSTNAELPNVVFEALRQRELDGAKARTVVINEPFVPWKKGHKAYSEDLNAYLEAAFVRVKIGAPKSNPIRTPVSSSQAPTPAVENDLTDIINNI